jgi:N-acetylated-alpha-linked acidic dipeptidase
MHFTKTPKRLGIFASVVLSAITLLTSTSGQSNGENSRTFRGYSEQAARSQWELEQRLRSVPSPDLLREYMKHLSAEPHHIGSAYGKQNAEYIMNKFLEWGFKAQLEEFDVLFPTPKERHLEMLEPVKYKAELKEPALAEDPDSSDVNQLPTYNAYSADGDVTGQLVYVNYGVPADYEELRKLGVDVKGKIVIARYGASWRGIKPKVAYEHGAVGCLIYSDPRDDGFFQGDVYPEGAFRPEHGVQRGSVMDMPIHPGDPLTPGWGAVKSARRLPRNEAEVIMKIPVLPISYGDALPLLKALRGPVAPASWRGALPITYHVGPGPSRVNLKLSFDWSLHTLYNVIARIEGAEYPDEWIVYGNHHDAWVNGAADPISGMVTVMEVGRALGELMKSGWRPKRTIILCGWDGEEPALLGSTEWVEAHADELKQKAVVYLNSDSNGKGWLNVGGSHSLERLINEVARDVEDPKSKRPLVEVLRERRSSRSATDEDKEELTKRADLRISALGSGSDYTPFIQHLGIASLNSSFGGEGGGGVYHSIYDSFAWYTKFSDGTFEYGRALSQFNGTVVLRLANAEVLPFEFTNLAETVGRYINELEKLSQSSGAPKSVNLSPMKSAHKSLLESARRYESALVKATSTGLLRNNPTKAPEQLKNTKMLNELLYKSERKLTDDGGLPRRPWFKHQIYAPGFYTGYGVKTIPGVREALEQNQWAEVATQIKKVSGVLLGLASHIDQATRLLEAK